MKIISWNVNGIRSCIAKNFWNYFDTSQADIFCLQETKITAADFAKLARTHGLRPLPGFGETDLGLETPTEKNTRGFFALAPSKKAGYAGVANIYKEPPLSIQTGLGDERFDDEGRVLWSHFKTFTLVNVYIPNGGRTLERIPYKIEFSDLLLKKLQRLRKKQPNILVCGDMNVAHQEIDIKNAKSNIKNSGFTPVEREWFTKFLNCGWIDVYRHQHPEARNAYTWWSYRPGVREKNIGWRIDYFVATEEMKNIIKNSTIQADIFGSDHCPVSVDLA